MKKLKETAMKKMILSTTLVCLAAAGLWAILVYNATLVNEPSLAYNKNFTLNLSRTPNASGIANLSAQAVYSSASLTTDTFNDGRVSTASVTVTTVSGLVASTATNHVTIAANSVIQSSAAYDSLVLVSTNGLTGATVTMNGTRVVNHGWRVDLATHTATDIATDLNTYVYPVIANSHGTETITLTARKRGVVGNTYTLVSSTPAALTAGTAHFTHGQDSAFANQYITVNGRSYYRGYYWNLPSDPPETSTGTAVSIASLLSTIAGIHATATGSVVYATATAAGTAANAFTIVSSTPAAMTVLTPTFTGGVDNAQVCINGTCLVQGTDWTKGASVTATALSIAGAINANSSLNTLVVSTNVAGVVKTTSTLVGTAANYTLTSSTPAALSVSHPTYVGGQNASFTVGSPTINIPSHGYTTAVAVLLSTGGATPPSPLVNQTTYYAILVDANNIQLATTSARAQAGTYVTFTSSSTTGPHTYTLTPLAYAGNATLQWFASNDGTNYNPLDISSVTYSSPSSTPTSTVWDFGAVNYKYFQLDVVAPTAGGLNLVVTVQGSN